MLPEYCCAVIQDRRGWLLLQLRPNWARFAANQLTCFGGRREADEDPLQCLRRELGEELGWAGSDAAACCQLWQGNRFIAQFYRMHFDADAVTCEAGHAPLWAPWRALPGLPVSLWHRCVLRAVEQGELIASIDGIPR